jgi:hypothetical protein
VKVALVDAETAPSQSQADKTVRNLYPQNPWYFTLVTLLVMDAWLARCRKWPFQVNICDLNWDPTTLQEVDIHKFFSSNYAYIIDNGSCYSRNIMPRIPEI